jgi:acetylornithine/N-succinyldiaminopimelate aminotransferase
MSTTRESFGKVIVPTYNPWNFIPVKGKGVYLWSDSGDEYIDLTGGIAVTCVGHCNDEIVEVLKEQSEKLWHVSNFMANKPQLALATKLQKSTFADKVFFSNSGLEANEAALKLARKYAFDNFGNDKNEIISFKNSFHGRSLFTIAVGGNDEYCAGFHPVPKGLHNIDINNDEDIKKAFSSKTAGVIVEPIFGESGVVEVGAKKLKLLRDLCDEHNALLIFDEVQTGVGRTGKLFSYQKAEVVPDILTSAKGLGGGFPIGATLTTSKIADSFVVGTHGSTFGGNPLATATAGKVLDIVSRKSTMENVQNRHNQFKKRLLDIENKFGIFEPMRGSGLMIGLEIKSEFLKYAKELFETFIDNRILVVPTAKNVVVRLLPSLLITEKEVDIAMDRMCVVCEDFLGKIK